jgi:hypothetical protein
MDHPDEPVSISFAGEGDIAEVPDTFDEVAITNEEGKPVGYLVRWDSDEWIYADINAIRWLQWLRSDEYSNSTDD